MSFEGHIQDGVVVFDEPIELPDGTPVRVEVVGPRVGENSNEPQPGHFLKHYQKVIGVITELPPDAALNHDHYLYRQPKK
jgi:hypothetical protein